MFLFKSKLAGIQYWGKKGITQEALDAVIRLIQYDDRIKQVRILTSPRKHCLLITLDYGDLIAIKSGFASGYPGEGPRGFSYALALLHTHKFEIDEYEVKNSILNRLDNSALTKVDIEKIKSTDPVRPQRFWDYIYEDDFHALEDENFWKNFRPVVPFAIIDSRIIDLAISFWENPDYNLIKGYTRLEDIFRKRTGLKDGYGSNLFSESFVGSTRKLMWRDVNENEQRARAHLFSNAYSAYRNPRAHRELKSHRHEYLSEFLLLNHLYRLEKEAIDVDI